MDINIETYNQVSVREKGSFIQRYHLHLTVLLIIVYILSRLIGNNILTYLMFTIISLVVCLSNTSQITYLLFLFSPMFLYITINQFPIYNIIIGILFLKRVVVEKERIHALLILSVIYLVIIELIGMLFSGVGFSLNQIKFFIIIFITLMQLYRPANKYDNTLAAKYLIWGTFIYAIFYIANNYNTIINDSIRVGGLGDLDPNTYALYNLFAVAIVLLFVFSKIISKREILIYALMIITILIAGIMTLSKSYFLVTGLMLILFWLAKRDKVKTNLLYIIFITAIIVLIQNNNYIKETFNHLLARFTTASDLNALTTGRFAIFIEYIKKLSERPVLIFLGGGMYSYLSILGLTIRPHNSVIEALCAWGIFGIVTFLCMYIMGGKIYKKGISYIGKIRFINLMPLIVLVVYMQSLTLLFEEATYAYIIMAIMLIYTPGSVNKK